MTLHEFSLLDKMEQVEAFWDAPLVGVRSGDQFLIECRQIDSFYVEYKIQEGYHTDMRSFKNPDFLSPYLEQIEINIHFW
jgi:hypothetical protein